MRLRPALLALLLAPPLALGAAQAQPNVPASPAPAPLPQAQQAQTRQPARQIEVPPQDGCPEAQVQAMSLPHLKKALASNQELVIVAIGSSSTQGWMASDIGHAFPSVLQSTIARALPQTQVVVINRGIGGQDAAEEVPRLQADVIAAKPQLVIWQVGANGVLRETDPAVFKKLVAAGVASLQAADADVILMDNQRSPRILASAGHSAMDKALAELADTDRVNLFSRGALMDEWQGEGMPYGHFVSSDGLHHNDLGYRCVGEALATAVVAALKEPGKAGGTAAGND